MKLTMNRRIRNAQPAPTSHLQVGSQLFHNGVPVQLLYRVGPERNDDETWRVRPLFVEGPDRNEQFHRSDAISYLHTMKAPGWYSVMN